MGSWLLLLFPLLLFFHAASAQPGFLSLDCGGPANFTDALGLSWTSDVNFIYGEVANISVANETRKQYTTVRHFPADSRKYCYRLDVTSRTRYLLRATFLYGDFDSNNVYPKFDISVGPTHWSTIVISDANTIESIELIFLASSSSISVCLSNATTGKPFISTLELRQFNGSVYFTAFENQFYLSVSARINFGADSVDPVRYPDDPYDRIWESDSVKKANYLVDVAAGTKKVSTDMPINVNIDERPPEKVMQTAVVGMNGSLTYRLNLDGFPGFGWAFTYFAEIEDLDPTESRKFRLVLPGNPEMSKAVVNIEENAQGKYRLYEPGYTNLSLPFVLNFRFGKTSDSSRGPLLNAMEINKYLEKNDGSLDGDVISGVILLYSTADWAQEGGDPCLPVPWSWVQCNSDARPQIIKLSLSSKNLSGTVPSGLTKLTGLVELWLDGNSLTGPIPDFTGCTALEIIHLENNQLTGELPSSLLNLPNLRELYVQNNMLSGTIPSGIDRKVTLNYSGNINLHEGARRGRHMGIIIGLSVGAAVLLITTIVSYLLMQKGKKRHPEQEQLPDSLPVQRVISTLNDAPGEAAHCFTSLEIEDATKKFEKKIGSGGFGVVYYGKMKDGREIAVKVLTSNSYQGKREFSNEVSLLSRIHHRNLVQFLGFCQEVGKSMLVYEFMHNGTLKEHLYGPLKQGRSINWIRRLEIAEDAAKGIEYLHTGCVPAVIHRDLKTSNILLDKNMRAKVADFGLSKLAVDGASHVSSVVRGTVGYLDPEYYISQQLTDKSDVYTETTYRMAPKLSHLLLAILVIFSIQTFKSWARTLKPEHQQSFSSFLQKLEGVQKGQAAEGLLDLKKYLKKFGYYPSDATLTSSDFDDHLELALKAYQKFYRLNVTGNLDSSTTQQMMIPRCGVPDIINPPPSTEPTSTESKHKKFHMVAHYEFGSNKWPPSKYALTYKFGPGVQVFDLNTLRSVCADAFQKWAEVTSFTFTEVTDGASADIVIAFYSGDHGDGASFDGPGKILAHGFFPQDGRLHYDADENWSTNPAMDQTDLESVSVHEIGHLLGLHHSNDLESIMYPSIQIGTKKRDLTQDDIDGIHALYPN